MARPTKEENLKKATKEAILSALRGKGNNEKYLLDQVDVYMGYFEDLLKVNEKLADGFDVELSKEKRQITKEMRNILCFLGLKPLELQKGDLFEAL